MTAPAAEYTTSCRLCGKPVAKSPPLNVPVIGPLSTTHQKFVALLLKHLTKHHPQELQEGIALYEEFRGLSICAAFTFPDPSIVPRLELTRATIFAQLRKNVPTDDQLSQTVAALDLPTEQQDAKVLNVLKNVRAACCELGEYAPKVP